MFDNIENQLNNSHSPDKKKKSKSLKKISIYAIAVAAVVVGLFSYGVIYSDDSLSGFRKLGQGILKPLSFFSFASDKKLQGEDQDRVNILLLGIGGEGHEGAFLTDTIMLASYKPSTKQVALLSIPRDLVVNLKQYGWRKINSANAFGEVSNPGKGPEKTASVVSDITGQSVDYYVRVDFSGFKKLIDQFGGVDINVESTLEDYKYPIEGNELLYPIEDRYEHLLIEKGLRHLDGATALKYARSRHGTGGEGSDFARSRRQQQIMLAFKEKLLKYKNLLQPNRVKALLNAYQENVVTNMDFWEMAKMGLILKDFDKSNIINRVLDDSPNGPLMPQNFNGVFILEPKARDYSDIKNIAKNIFDTSYIFKSDAPLISKTEAVETTPIETAQPSIDVLNGTFITGLAKTQGLKLTDIGLKVLFTGNAQSRLHEKTLIYTANPDKFLDIAEKLASLYAVEQIQPLTQMAENLAEMATKADFVVILGTDVKQ